MNEKFRDIDLILNEKEAKIKLLEADIQHLHEQND